MRASRTVDARGLFCPLPIIELARAIRTAAPGDIIQLLATDPGVRADVPAWCEATGNPLLSLEAGEEGFSALVRKAPV